VELEESEEALRSAAAELQTRNPTRQTPNALKDEQLAV